MGTPFYHRPNAEIREMTEDIEQAEASAPPMVSNDLHLYKNWN